MLSQDEKDALLELKQQGYSFSEAMGFIASSRMGNTSKVERELTTPLENKPSDVVSDISQGFEGAKQSFEEGMTRTFEASQRKTLAGRTAGRIGAGFRFAGDALGSIGSGLIRALPFGTEAMDKVEGTISSGFETAVTSPVGQKTQELYSKLPQGVRQTVGDVGNTVLGGLGIAGALTVPSASTAFKNGIKEFASTGIKDFGVNGIRMSAQRGLSPENIMQRVARISKGKQTNFESRAGESVGEYLVNRGIFGDPEEITSQLYKRMQESKGRIDSGLEKVGGQYKNNAVQDALEQLAEREARVSTARTLSPDSARVNELLKKHNREGLTLTEVNEVKRLYERNVKLDYLRDNVSDKIAQANNIDTKLRGFVEDTAAKNGFKNVKEINRETYLAKQLLDDLGAEYAGQMGNNFISLSDAMFLAEAASNPTALAAFGLKKLLSGKSTMSAVARIIAGKRPTKGLPSAEIDLPKLEAPKGPIDRVPDAQTIPLSEKTVSTQTAAELANPNIKQPTPAPMPERLGLPEPTSNFQGSPIPMQAPASQIGVQERGVGTVPPPTEGTQPLIKNLLDANDEATMQVRTQMLELSEAGKRIFKPHDATQDSNVIGVPSTFPKWISPELRSKDLFTRVWKHIDNGTMPKSGATKEAELYAEIKTEIARREIDILETQNMLGDFSAKDIPFSLLLAVGGTAAAYYGLGENDLLMPVLAIGALSRFTPKQRIGMINRQLDKLSVAEAKLIKDGARYSDAPLRSLVEARKKLTAERDTL